MLVKTEKLVKIIFQKIFSLFCPNVLPTCLPMIAEVLELELQMVGELPRGYYQTLP